VIQDKGSARLQQIKDRLGKMDAFDENEEYDSEDDNDVKRNSFKKKKTAVRSFDPPAMRKSISAVNKLESSPHKATSTIHKE